MNQITNISLDISVPQLIIVHEKQGDSGRWIYADILDKGASFSIPVNTYGIVRIKKPDGTACVYDSDGSSTAVVISGNTVRVKLVDQALTAAGKAVCSIGLYNANAERITAFNFALDIELDPVADAEIVSSDYYNILTAQIATVIQMYESIQGLTASATSLGASQEATATVSGGSGAPFNIAFGIPRGPAGLTTNFIAYTNKSVQAGAFVSNSTHAYYPYRAQVPLGSAVTSGMTAIVIFDADDAASGMFAPECDVYSGGVYIYATERRAVTIPTVLAIQASAGS